MKKAKSQTDSNLLYYTSITSFIAILGHKYNYKYFLLYCSYINTKLQLKLVTKHCSLCYTSILYRRFNYEVLCLEPVMHQY